MAACGLENSREDGVGYTTSINFFPSCGVMGMGCKMRNFLLITIKYAGYLFRSNVFDNNFLFLVLG